MKKILGSTVASIAILFAAGVNAEPAVAPVPNAMATAHLDKPGPRFNKGNFIANVDANKDGKLSLDEMKAFHAERAAKEFERLDANKDGVVTKEEIEQARANREARWAEHIKAKGIAEPLPIPPHGPPGIEGGQSK